MFHLKGGKQLINAFEQLVKQGYDVHLIMVSNIPSNYLSSFGDKPWVTFVKANLEKEVLKHEYFAKADVFVHPTFCDGFGMVVLEALSFGLPIITTRMYAIPEMVEHGKNGYLLKNFPNFLTPEGKIDSSILKTIKKTAHLAECPGIEKQIAKYATKLLDPNVRKSMREAALELFASKFARSIRDQKMLNVIKESVTK